MRAFALIPAFLAASASAVSISFFTEAACQTYSVDDTDASANCELGCQNLNADEGSILVSAAEPNQRVLVYEGADCTGTMQSAAQCCGADGICTCALLSPSPSRRCDCGANISRLTVGSAGTACMTPPDDGAKWKSYLVERIPGIAGGGTACPCKQPGCPDGVPTS